MIRLGQGSTIIRIWRNRIESATSSQSGTPQPASQPHLPAAAKYRLLAWLGSSNVHAILQLLQEIWYTPPSCARRSLQAFPSGAAWCIRPRGVYAILRILREMTYTPPSCARVVYMPFSVFLREMTYTPPLIYTALLPSFFPVWSVLPFQNELSGWEGPPAQGSQRVGGASCSGSWVGWRVDCPILPKIRLWKNETLTFLDELIARCLKFLLVLQFLW